MGRQGWEWGDREEEKRQEERYMDMIECLG